FAPSSATAGVTIMAAIAITAARRVNIVLLLLSVHDDETPARQSDSCSQSNDRCDRSRRQKRRFLPLFQAPERTRFSAAIWNFFKKCMDCDILAASAKRPLLNDLAVDRGQRGGQARRIGNDGIGAAAKNIWKI